MSDLMPLEEALDRLLSRIPLPSATEEVPLGEALGRVLAEPVSAATDVPPADNSSMDGYALAGRDFRPGEPMPISQRIAAGCAPEPLRAGTAARIFTGAEIPPGADAVVMQEQAEAEGGQVRILAEIKPGQNIRSRGQDMAAGTPLLEAGVMLRPQTLGVLASTGIERVRVYRRPSVALLSTGDELVQPGQALGPGQIYDANRFLLTGLLQQAGVVDIRPMHVPDAAEPTAQALREAARADLILSSGGVSVGEEDHVKAQVEALGELNIWRIRVKPGKPFAAGRVGDTPFIGLPGNPASSLVTFCLLALPALHRLQGRQVQPPWQLQLPAGFSREQPQTRDEFLRVRVENGRLLPQGNQSSGVLSNTLEASGLARVPAETSVAEGQLLTFMPFSSLCG
ncbi:molybdopterin molybdotransferase MoeA [Marinobacterium sp. AK62]|uniref:Molybdopterin molybdenumtransferase n=1 Tax=Marinobacterium alkalitolerans TaxID=1542925 RepID=A0ABS3ZC67_9GAMM|nr:gephyrin-like molybdotransferase Glp [Marinobacterium alkalitolerans]MBP0049302.1 molybdopterin molybdotransferase MoeA [Marinobacterium alkalitolerans]